MFKIIIKNLNLFGYHGVKEIEKKNGQNFLYNIEILLNKDNFLSEDKNEDDLENTLNYSEVIKLIKYINNDHRFDLLETLAQTIADRILELYQMAEKVSVIIEKTSPPIKDNLESVGIEYKRDRKSIKPGRMSNRKSESGSEEVDIYMSLGSNIGNREDNLRKAVGLINSNPDIRIIKVSSIYETDPMYFKEQNSFYNIVLKAQVNLKTGPFELVGFLKGIEYGMGRKKSEKKYNPRIIDIDLLYFGEMYIESDFLTIPHPRITERKFVLVPLSEISPEFKVRGEDIEKFIKASHFTEQVDLIKSWDLA
ncbi:MAG: 2-amino-4-hydroxy-6-hydroxymethyldihydropteridine diphosphokinase [Actinomycetota bacterium]|nr:2-amino-4-hydroxy-6-hydroxymethyldihydropteridine diphosphokinase [Actinomycetota bacterium]